MIQREHEVTQFKDDLREAAKFTPEDQEKIDYLVSITSFTADDVETLDAETKYKARFAELAFFRSMEKFKAFYWEKCYNPSILPAPSMIDDMERMTLSEFSEILIGKEPYYAHSMMKSMNVGSAVLEGMTEAYDNKDAAELKKVLKDNNVNIDNESKLIYYSLPNMVQNNPRQFELDVYELRLYLSKEQDCEGCSTDDVKVSKRVDELLAAVDVVDEHDAKESFVDEVGYYFGRFIKTEETESLQDIPSQVLAQCRNIEEKNADDPEGNHAFADNALHDVFKADFQSLLVNPTFNDIYHKIINSHFFSPWLKEDQDEEDTESVEEVHASTIDRDEIKLYYPGLEDIVDQLLDNNIEFGHEGDVDLTDADGIVIASASMLVRGLKIAIEPTDESSATTLEAAGYRIINSKNFNINELKSNNI